ncbi:MAG: D-alanyl-D-alanine carboxypeptidase [Clostridia bacterium]|nr:D-alanyl-D-alanine carboxypeptidase [Clostridia bacterium]
MKKTCLFKILSWFISLVIAMNFTAFADGSFYPASGEDSFPDISAVSYALLDARTGELLFSRNENQRMPMASITKIMTALVVLENSKLDEMVTVTSDSCGIEGSSIYLYEGETLSVKDLLYALMLESANDAAVCLAIHVGGSVEEFSDMMNNRASELGIKNTNFNNPHGLEDPEHYSTARDIALIWQEAMKNSTFRQIVATKTHRIDLPDEEGYRFLSNHNKLLKSYEYCIGGKTGFTKTAGRCLVTGAKRDDLEFVMVTLNDPSDWQDHENLLNYAMNLYSKVDVAKEGSLTVDMPVVGGSAKKVILSNIEPLTLSVRDVTKLSSRVEAPRFMYAPVTTTEKPVAKVVYSYDGKDIGELDLYPQSTVKTVKKDNFLKRILNSIFK